MEFVLAFPLIVAGLWLSALAIARVKLSFTHPGKNSEGRL